MSIKDPSETISEARRENSNGGLLGILRAVALIAAVAGALGSLGLTIGAGRTTPWLLLLFFVIAVLSPFVALLWAAMVSRRWAVTTRAALYCVTLIITLGSLATYGNVISPPTGSARAFMFVVVPPVSWLFMAIVVPIAALISRRRSH